MARWYYVPLDGKKLPVITQIIRFGSWPWWSWCSAGYPNPRKWTCSKPPPCVGRWCAIRPSSYQISLPFRHVETLEMGANLFKTGGVGVNESLIPPAFLQDADGYHALQAPGIFQASPQGCMSAILAESVLRGRSTMVRFGSCWISRMIFWVWWGSASCPKNRHFGVFKSHGATINILPETQNSPVFPVPERWSGISPQVFKQSVAVQPPGDSPGPHRQ